MKQSGLSLEEYRKEIDLDTKFTMYSKSKLKETSFAHGALEVIKRI
ncbi:MAG: hypothetical protein ACTSRE_00095 [Promethearchaeota archaeon]